MILLEIIQCKLPCCVNGGKLYLRLKDPDKAADPLQRNLPISVVTQEDYLTTGKTRYVIEYDENLLADPLTVLTALDFDLICVDFGDLYAVETAQANPLLSEDADNSIILGSDGKLYASGFFNSLTAGDGLVNSGTGADPILDVVAGDRISVTGDQVNLDLPITDNNSVLITSTGDPSGQILTVPECGFLYRNGGEDLQAGVPSFATLEALGTDTYSRSVVAGTSSSATRLSGTVTNSDKCTRIYTFEMRTQDQYNDPGNAVNETLFEHVLNLSVNDPNGEDSAIVQHAENVNSTGPTSGLRNLYAFTSISVEVPPATDVDWEITATCVKSASTTIFNTVTQKVDAVVKSRRK